MARGDFIAAAEAFGQRLAGHADESPTRMKLALCLHEAGRAADAAREGGQALRELGEGHPATLFYALALVDGGRTKQAKALAEAVAVRDPANLFAAGILCLVAMRRGQPREGLSILDEKGVFEGPLFRAHLLAEVEACLAKAETGDLWSEGYLKTVL
jgi:thioredoxin-like negative regulator of GroEL